MKLRTLITLHAIFKHSDENHRMSTPKINEYLKPYGLECTRRVTNDMTKVMREFGIDVRYKGNFDKQGFWINDRPLSDPYLNRLIFAVSTNPHLSREQATDILSYLSPLVTEFQEPKLVGTIDNVPDMEADDMLFYVYSTICEAIRLKRRVVFNTEYLEYKKITQSICKHETNGILFTPKCLCQSNSRLYMIGYNNTNRHTQAIDIKDITNIKLSFKISDPNSPKIQKILSELIPKVCIPEEKPHVIYRGEATFFSRSRFMGKLYSEFGKPCKPIERDHRYRITYTVSDAIITPKTLHWLAGVEGHGIRLKGPDSLIKAVKEYYAHTGETLTTPSIPVRRKGSKRKSAGI